MDGGGYYGEAGDSAIMMRVASVLNKSNKLDVNTSPEWQLSLTV